MRREIADGVRGFSGCWATIAAVDLRSRSFGGASSVQCGPVTCKKTSTARPDSGYDAVLADLISLIETGRRAVVRTSNVVMTTT